MPWWIWLLVALICAIAEVVGSGLVFAGIAGAALITAIVAVPFGAAISASAFIVEAVVFGAASVIYVVGLRPPVIRMISGQHPNLLGSQSAHQHLVGKRGVVTREVTEDEGQIRVGHGEFWSARAYSPGTTMPEGKRVEIILVDGLTALVAPDSSVRSPIEDAGSQS